MIMTHYLYYTDCKVSYGCHGTGNRNKFYLFVGDLSFGLPNLPESANHLSETQDVIKGV
jgi:hypothetical protein